MLASHLTDRITYTSVKDHLNSNKSNENIFKALEDQINGYIGRSWIKSSELSCNDGSIQQAELHNMLNAELYTPRSCIIEKAKLLWKKGDVNRCLKTLESAEKNIFAGESIHKEVKFLIPFYNTESSKTSSTDGIKQLKEASSCLNTSKAWLTFAKYLDAHLSSLPVNADHHRNKYNSEIIKHQPSLLTSYFKSTELDTNSVHQSLPIFQRNQFLYSNIYFKFSICFA